MSSLLSLSNEIEALAQKAGTHVLHVDSRARGGASAVVLAEGILVAASHAVEREEDLHATLPSGETVPVAFVGRDRGTDVAVLKIDRQDLPVPTWASGAPPVGRLVVAVARPGESLRTSVSAIGVSGRSFRTWTGGKLEAWVSTDRRLPWGFSGGLVVDASGAALGIATIGLVRKTSLIVSGATLRRVADELLAHGKVRKGYLGVGVYPARIPSAIAKAAGAEGGVVIVGLDDGGPAAQAGLLIGDLIVSIDGEFVESPRGLSSLLSDRAGAKVTLKLVRAGVVVDVSVTIGERK